MRQVLLLPVRRFSAGRDSAPAAGASGGLAGPPSPGSQVVYPDRVRYGSTVAPPVSCTQRAGGGAGPLTLRPAARPCGRPEVTFTLDTEEGRPLALFRLDRGVRRAVRDACDLVGEDLASLMSPQLCVSSASFLAAVQAVVEFGIVDELPDRPLRLVETLDEHQGFVHQRSVGALSKGG